MTVLSDIIEIQITRETAAVAQTNFSTPLFVSAHTAFHERARVYSTIEAVGEDFAVTDSAYIAAQRLFGQQIRPTNIVIGRRAIPSTTLAVQSVTVGAIFSLTINEKLYTYTAVALDSNVEVAAGLKTAYDLDPVEGVTLTDAGGGTLTLAAPEGFSVRVTPNITQANQPPTETFVTAINAVSGVNDTWYAVMIESHAEVDVLAVAANIEATKKIFATSSSAADIKTTATTDLFSKLQQLGYQRTFGIYSESADTVYPECAWVGFQLQEQPGSNTWAYKTLSGVPYSRLSQTESKNIQSKGGTTYERVGGLNVTCGATMFGGEWIDVIVFVDWLEQRMKERLWFRLANSKKIPFTSTGAAIFEAEIRAQLNDGIRVGGLAESPAPRVEVPDVLSLPANMRAQRILDGIEFEARLAGAIHFVKIKGVVTV